MATSLYIFIDGTATPQGWSRVTAYNGDYVRISKTYADHGTTGGNATHTHGTSGVTINNNTTSSFDFDNVADNILVAHNHSAGTWNVGNANNDPAFYELEMIKIDLATWEAYNKTFPVGSILPSVSAVTGVELTRFSLADGKIIKLGTSGTTGGSSTHTHTVTSTTANGNGGTMLSTTAGAVFCTYNTSHHHTTSDTSSTSTSIPAQVATRLYQIASYVKHSTGGLVAFVDGTPSANWTLVDWDGSFLVSANSDATKTGSNNSTHTVSGTSSNTSLTGRSNVPVPFVNFAYIAHNPHNHTYSLTLANADMSPPYVKLVPVVLNSTLYAPSGGHAGQVIGLW